MPEEDSFSYFSFPTTTKILVDPRFGVYNPQDSRGNAIISREVKEELKRVLYGSKKKKHKINVFQQFWILLWREVILSSRDLN